VVQKYIERPLLFLGQRKFDIRVLVVHTGKGECYFYNEGYLRTSSKKYNVEDEDQKSMAKRGTRNRGGERPA